MSDGKIVSQFSYVDPNKIGTTLKGEVSHPRVTDYGVSNLSPPPINPELFTNRGDQHDDPNSKSSHYPDLHQRRPSSRDGVPSSPPSTPTNFPSTSTTSSSVTSKPKTRRSRLLSAPMILLYFTFALFGSYSLYNNINITENAVLQSLHWETSIQMEEWRLSNDEDWILPPNYVQLFGSESRIHHHETIIDGYEEHCYEQKHDEPTQVYVRTDVTCYESGKCVEQDVYDTKYESRTETKCEQRAITHSEPVYQPFYFFSQWRWVAMTPLTLQGSDSEPAWAKYWEDQYHRVSSKNEKYSATFKNSENKEFSYTFPNLLEYQHYLSQLGKIFSITRNSSEVTSVNTAVTSEHYVR